MRKVGYFLEKKNRLESAQLLLLYSSATTATLKRSYDSASGPTYTCSFYTQKKWFLTMNYLVLKIYPMEIQQLGA